VHDGVFIGGCEYKSKYYAEQLKEQIGILEKKALGYHKRILVLHQGIDRFLPYEFEIKLNDLPENFDYYAMGHIHKRIMIDYGRGKLVYPGSTEMWKVDEYEDYEKNGKGFALVELNDPPSVENINLNLKRKIIFKEVNASELDDKINSILNSINLINSINLTETTSKESGKEYKYKPMLYLNITGEVDRRETHKKITEKLSDAVLYLRIKYNPPETIESEEFNAASLNIKELINKHFNDAYHQKYSDLAFEIYEQISRGNQQKAKEIIKEAYKKFV